MTSVKKRVAILAAILLLAAAMVLAMGHFALAEDSADTVQSSSDVPEAVAVAEDEEAATEGQDAVAAEEAVAEDAQEAVEKEESGEPDQEINWESGDSQKKLFLYNGQAYVGYYYESATWGSLPEGITYANNNKVYTFTNFTYEGTGDVALYIVDEEATVKLQGTNQLGMRWDGVTKAAVDGLASCAFQGSDVTITGSGSLVTYSKQDGICADNLTFDEGFTGTFTSYDYGTAQACCLKVEGLLTIKSGTFKLTNTCTEAISAGKVNISGGTVNAKGGMSGISVINEDEGGKAEMVVSGGTVNAEGSRCGIDIFASNNSLEISGGTVNAKATGSFSRSGNQERAADFEMSGGIVLGEELGEKDISEGNPSVSEVKISGGTVNAQGESCGICVLGGYYSDVAKMTITGGIVTAKGTIGLYCYGTEALFTIAGGDITAIGVGGTESYGIAVCSADIQRYTATGQEEVTSLNFAGGITRAQGATGAIINGISGESGLTETPFFVADTLVVTGANEEYVANQTAKLTNKAGEDYVVIQPGQTVTPTIPQTGDKAIALGALVCALLVAGCAGLVLRRRMCA